MNVVPAQAGTQGFKQTADEYRRDCANNLGFPPSRERRIELSQRALLRVATSSHTAKVRIKPLTIICQ